MNLLNKKLKDKIKTLEDIDRQFITNIKSDNHISKKQYNNSNLNSIELLKKTKNEKFDEIYSDFYLNENAFFYNKDNTYKKKHKYSTSNNNLDNPTKEDSMEKDNETKKSTIPGIDVADRLNNYGIYLKNKIENQRQIQNNNIMQLMKPKISNRVGSKIRNPEKISERLYQNYKKNTVKNNKDNSMNNNSHNISGNLSNFTYHPKLNKKSIKIAKNLEPSFIRLNKKKKSKEKKNSEKKKTDNLNLYGGSLINNNKEKKDIFYNFSLMNNNINNINNNKKKEKNKNNKNIYEKMNDLYLRGIEQNQKKEKVYNDRQKKKEEEYKNYSFKPKINKNYDLNNRNNHYSKEKQKKNNSKKENMSNIYKKNFEWKKKIENEINKKKEKKEETISLLCTFKPIINNDYNYNNSTNNNKNDKNMSKILEEMNEYINKRRQNIQYKRNEENYKNKRLYGSGNKYEVKSTIPQEFELETEIRNRYMKKNKNRSCDNFHIKQYDLMDQYSDKKTLTNENNPKYWFFKEKILSNNCNSHNNTRGNNKNNETVSQFNFIEAVNLLHDKLDKLNI